MAIVLSRDDKIVVYIAAFSYAEFRERFLALTKTYEFSAAIDDPDPKNEVLDKLRDMMIAAGIDPKYVSTPRRVRETAQAIMNRLIDPLASPSPSLH